VAFVPDLMDRSRLAGAAEVTFVASAAELAGAAADADIAVLDLSRPGALDAARDLPVRVIGFAPHVERELLDAATAAGCDEVLPRSAFFRRIGELLG
jgi:hypothetical protein